MELGPYRAVHGPCSSWWNYVKIIRGPIWKPKTRSYQGIILNQLTRPKVPQSASLQSLSPIFQKTKGLNNNIWEHVVESRNITMKET